ncbi:MAG TPA: phosphoribosylglycinamide formyltransferase [Flavobacterium sp.]|jgi:phosphoribosylglycinamide formyltransferase-1
MKKIVIFASGSGSNAENIIRYFLEQKTAQVIAVFSNNTAATVLDKAASYQVPTYVFDKEELNSSIILEKLQHLQPDLIVLAGFLLKFPASIIKAFPNRIINIHPALLPKFGGKGMYGIHVHKAVLENKEPETGITIHYVNEHYDEGEYIFQKSIPTATCVTPEAIALKVLELEHKYFPKVIEQLLSQT